MTEINHPAERAIVLYDGECPLCRQSVRILRQLDWLGRLRYFNARETESLPITEVALEPVRLLEEMHVLTPDRKRAPSGFRAVRWLAWRLPLLWPVAPLLFLPGMSRLGQWLYLRVARNRYGLAPCHDGVCKLPQKPQ